MNDTFSFHAPAEVFRRRLDPRWIRPGIALTVLIVALSAFSYWVVTSERAADERRAAHPVAASELPVPTFAASPVLDDEAAMTAAGSALDVAREVAAQTGSFGDVATATLADELPDLVFVDGPSTAPVIVSVAAETDAWAAAVMGETDTCFWVKTTSTGAIRYESVTERGDCTGAAAMAADDVAW